MKKILFLMLAIAACGCKGKDPCELHFGPGPEDQSELSSDHSECS